MTPATGPNFRTRCSGNSARAFTLVELILVVVAIAILSAIAIPRYANSVARYRVNMAAKRVVADFTLARSAARSSGLGQVVDFTTPANGYTMTGLSAPDGRSGDYIVKLSDEPYRVSIASAAFSTATPPAQTVRFTRFGTPESGGVIVLQSGSYQKTILVDPITGRAEVQ